MREACNASTPLVQPENFGRNLLLVATLFEQVIISIGRRFQTFGLKLVTEARAIVSNEKHQHK